MKRALITTGLAVSVLASGTANAQSNASMMLKPWFGDHESEIKADAFFTPTEASPTGADVDLSIFSSTGRFRLDPAASYNPTIGYEFVQYEIGSSDAALPDDLTDISIAFGGSFGNKDLGEDIGEWQIGYTLGVGYAGFTPFSDGDAYYGRADLFAVKSIERGTGWLVGINYDGNRIFMPDVPLPAVSYFSRLNETTTYAIGFPINQLTWKPDEFWSLEIRSAIFFSFTGTLSYQATKDLRLFTSLVRRNDAFTIPTGFPNRRILFSHDRLELGLSYNLSPNVALTLAGGYTFNQEFEVGFDSRGSASLRELDDSGYIRGGIELKF